MRTFLFEYGLLGMLLKEFKIFSMTLLYAISFLVAGLMRLVSGEVDASLFFLVQSLFFVLRLVLRLVFIAYKRLDNFDDCSHFVSFDLYRTTLVQMRTPPRTFGTLRSTFQFSLSIDCV